MKRWSSLLFAVLCLVGGLAVSPACAAEWTPVDAFLLGAVNQITGPGALSGQMRKNGYELGLDEVNASGGILGLPVKIVYEDDQTTNPGAVAAARRLFSQQPIVAIFLERSTMVQALHPIIMQEKIPALFGASAWSISELKNPWFFRMRLNDRDTALVMTKFMVEELKKTKIAALYVADALGEGGHKETSAFLKEKYNITLVNAQKYTPGTKDYTAQLLAIRSSGANLMYGWSTMSEDCAIILRQFKQLGMREQMDFVGSTTYVAQVSLQIAGANANGIYSVYDFAFEDPRPQLQAWVKAYREKYKDDPDFWGQFNYDSVKLLADAAKRAGIIKKEGNRYFMMPLPEARAALAKALRETRNWQGAQGEYTADEHQDMIHSDAVVRVENEKPKLVKIIKLK